MKTWLQSEKVKENSKGWKKKTFGAKTGSRLRHIQIAGRREKKKDAFRTCEADVAKEQIHISERQKELMTEDKDEERTAKTRKQASRDKQTHTVYFNTFKWTKV